MNIMRHLLVGYFFLLIIAVFLKAIVLVKLWEWFIVPTFALPVLNIPQAIGISLTIYYFVGISVEMKEKNIEEKIRDIITEFTIPVVVLPIGFIVKSFM